MSAPGGIRRNFSNFKGLNQGADDLTRPVEFADEATNVEITRKGSVVKRPGVKSQTFVTTNSFHGLYSHVFSRPAPSTNTSFSLPNTVTTNTTSFFAPSGFGINWINTSALLTTGFYCTAICPTAGADYYTEYVVVKNLNFNVPSDAEVVGITVESLWRPLSVNYIKPILALTLDGGTTLETDIQLDNVPVTGLQELQIYGGKTDTLGIETLTPSIVNDSNFGVALRVIANAITSNPSGNVRLAYLKVAVNYRPAIDNSDTTKLFSFGKHLEEHSNGNIKIVYSPSGGGTPPPAKLFILPDTATGQYKVDLQINDLSIVGFPKYYDTDTAPALIKNLYDDINATADFYMEATPAGEVATTVTEQPYIHCPGHTFTDVDNVTIWSERYLTNTSRYILGSDYNYVRLDGNVSADAGTVMGIFNQLVASIPEQDGVLLPANDTTAGDIEVPWQVPTNNILTTNLYKIIQGETRFQPSTVFEEEPFVSAQTTHGVNDTNTSFVSKSSNIYFGLPFYINSGNLTQNGTTLTEENGGLWKHDGRDTYLAGMPSIPTPDSIVPVLSYGNDGMTASSTYKFKFQYCYRDYRGNFIEGPLSDEIAMQTSATQLNAVFTWNNPRAHRAPFAWRGVLPQSDIGGWVTIITDEIPGTDGGILIGNVLPGTEVALFNAGIAPFTGNFTTRIIADTDATPLGTTYYLDEPIRYMPAGGSLLTYKHHACLSQIRIRVWRTVADGSLFYFCCDLPAIRIPGETYAFFDGTADSDLGEPLIEPDRRPSLFPKISTLSTHQGLIIASGNPDDPETIYFEDQLIQESSPASTSSFQVVGSQSSGAVTAHASDNDDMLAVFKDNHYFNVVGDLDSLSFQVLEVSKGQYGCSAHAAIAKVNNTLLFPSNTGFKAIAGGQLITDFNDVFVDDFLGNEYTQSVGQAIATENQDKFVLRRATATYFPETQQYVCFIPCESGVVGFEGSREPNENSRVFVLHLKQQAWTKWQMSPDLNMAGGVTVHRDELYWAARRYNESTYAMMWGKLYRQRNDGTSIDFLDETQPIEMRLRMTWDSLDNPSDYFVPVFLKLYQFNNEDFLTAFDLTVKEYRNYNENTVYTQASRTFSTAADKEKRLKFKNGRASSISLEFYNNTAQQKPVLTGYEYEVRNPYLPRIKAGRNR